MSTPSTTPDRSVGEAIAHVLELSAKAPAGPWSVEGSEIGQGPDCRPIAFLTDAHDRYIAVDEEPEALEHLSPTLELAAAAVNFVREHLPHLSPAPDGSRAAILEEAARIAEDHTPAKFDGTLAAHVTGKTIARAIRTASRDGAQAAPAPEGLALRTTRIGRRLALENMEHDGVSPRFAEQLIADIDTLLTALQPPAPKREAVAPSPAALADEKLVRIAGHLRIVAERGVEVDSLDFRNEHGEWIAASHSIREAAKILASLRSTAGPAGGPSLEEVARLIDPTQWRFIDWAVQNPRPAGVPANEDPRQRFGRASLSVAEQIAALYAPLLQGQVQHSEQWERQYREELDRRLAAEARAREAEEALKAERANSFEARARRVMGNPWEGVTIQAEISPTTGRSALQAERGEGNG